MFASFFERNIYVYHSLFILQLFILCCIYYRLLIKKKRMIQISFFFLLVMVSMPFFPLDTKNQTHLIGFDILFTYVFIILYTNIYHYQNRGKEKHYYYFNRGLFLFALSTLVITVVSLILRVFTRDEYYTSFIRSAILLFDTLFQLFLIKEWFFLNRKKNEVLLKK